MEYASSGSDFVNEQIEACWLDDKSTDGTVNYIENIYKLDSKVKACKLISSVKWDKFTNKQISQGKRLASIFLCILVMIGCQKMDYL